MKTPREIAVTLIEDALQLQVESPDFQSQYKMAKSMAKYCTSKLMNEHAYWTERHQYWNNVLKEIDKL